MKSEYGFNSEEISEALVKHSSYYDVWHRVIKCVNYYLFFFQGGKGKKEKGEERTEEEGEERVILIYYKTVFVARKSV